MNTSLPKLYLELKVATFHCCHSDMKPLTIILHCHSSTAHTSISKSTSTHDRKQVCSHENVAVSSCGTEGREGGREGGLYGCWCQPGTGMACCAPSGSPPNGRLMRLILDIYYKMQAPVRLPC